MSEQDPRAEIERRRQRWRLTAAAAGRSEARLGAARLITFAVGIGLAVWLLRSHPLAVGWLLLPAALFAALVARHAEARRQHRRADRAVAYWDDLARRLDGGWQGTGRDGLHLPPAAAPSAADLDLFGKGSLFELLDTCRTALGEATLARWLVEPVAADTLRARQAAVAELVPEIDLREALFLLGEEAGDELDAEALVAWAVSPPRLRATWPLAAARVLALLAVAAVVLWAATPAGVLPLLAVATLELALGRIVARPLGQVVEEAGRAVRGGRLLAELLADLETRAFTAPRLVALRARLEAQGEPPSRRMAVLQRHVDVLLDAGRNAFFAPVAFLLQTRLRRAHALEHWRATRLDVLPDWLAAAGELEALAALATHAWAHPADVFPEVVDEGPRLLADDLGHVLLPEHRCVRNDVDLGSQHALLLVSGSNMSGKSTLLRAVGTAVVLARTGAPVRARRLVLSPFAVGASLRAVDSLQEGTSRFLAEVKHLAAVVALLQGPWPVLFLLDEILHGTNSSERLRGASAIVRRLVEGGAVGLVTTHDLALTALVDDLAPRARNVHFEDGLHDGHLVFDYKLKDGVVKRGNALAVMREMGLDV